MKGRIYGRRVTIMELKKILRGLLLQDSRRVPAIFLWGPPGVGKSSVVCQVARELGLKFIDLRLSLLDPVDLRGIPVADREKRECYWTRPVFLPKDGAGILFLDEINLASPSVQAAAYQLVLDKAVGEHKLPDSWHIVAAGNRREDSSLVTQLSDPLISRFVHFEVEIDVEEWFSWAIASGIDERVISFLKFRPELLLKVDSGRSSVNYPCPRSWEFCSRLLQAGVDPATAAEASVSRGVAAEFCGFLQVYEKMPDVERVLSGAEEVDENLEPSVLIATLTALASRMKESDIDRVLSIVLSLNRRELGVYLLKLMVARFEKQVMKSVYWKEVVKRYKEVVL